MKMKKYYIELQSKQNAGKGSVWDIFVHPFASLVTGHWSLATSLILTFVFLSLVTGHLPLANAAFSSKDAGTSGAAFLKIGAGARPNAMGEAYTAVSDDVNAISWNAAGLSLIKDKNEFIAMRAEMFQDMQYNYFAFAHPTRSAGTFAIGIVNFNVADIPQRSGDTDNPDSTFSSNDTAYTIGYGIKLTAFGLPSQDEEGGLHLGLALKAIHQTLAGETANSFGTDIGSLYSFSNIPLNLGLSVQNLGAKVQYKYESDPLPLTIKVGAAYRMCENWGISGMKNEDGEKNGLLLAVDGDFARDSDASASMGMEFARQWSKNVRSAVRAGYRSDRSRQLNGTGSGVSAGAGVSYKFCTFDFSWTPFGDLGNTFRYSVKLRF